MDIRAAMIAAAEQGTLPAYALADSRFFRSLVIAAWRNRDVDMCEAIAQLFNAGFRGAALDLRAAYGNA